jgi:predicted nuclease of restriction endonuclease-like RecB superfamily
MTPDFSFEKDGMQAYLEVVGFWTEEYLAKNVQKLTKLPFEFGQSLVLRKDHG